MTIKGYFNAESEQRFNDFIDSRARKAEYILYLKKSNLAAVAEECGFNIAEIFDRENETASVSSTTAERHARRAASGFVGNDAYSLVGGASGGQGL